MRKQEAIGIVKYLYFMQSRLDEAVRDCNYRYVRRDLDSIDLLEEIIALENKKLFEQVTQDILHILNLDYTDKK